MAYIAFRSDLKDTVNGAADWADFVVEQPTTVTGNNEGTAQVYHYSGIVHMKAHNVLITHD